MIRRIRLLMLLVVVPCLASLAADAPGPVKPSLTDAEKQAGWKLLFDGETTAGWRGLGQDAFPDKAWNVKDGCLHCLGGTDAKDDLTTSETYENFELSWEWMMPKEMGNSGVKYRIQEAKGKTAAYGPEYQMMTDGDKIDKNATGSLYDVLPPHDKKTRPPGEFNQSRILQHGDHVEHWLNGVKVLEFDFSSADVKAAVAKSKFKKNGDWAKQARGHIILQDHTDEAYFRNIKIRELPMSEKN
jgi:hypothetical protein